MNSFAASKLRGLGTSGLAKVSGFFDDFKAFINRGNVVDMAIGIAIGTAFSAIVNSLMTDLISPILGLIDGQATLDELFLILKYANHTEAAAKPRYPTVKIAQNNGAITLNYGRFIQSILTFLIIAFVLFLIVKLVYMIYKKEEAPPSTDWPCPKCKESVKLGATKCPHCTAEPIHPESAEEIES